MLIFDSLDEDRMNRQAEPIYVTNQASGYISKLNSYMDHDPMDLIETREQRFPSIVYQRQDYTITYTGRPMTKQRFFLDGQFGTSGFIVSIKYPEPGDYEVYDENGNVVQTNEYDADAGMAV